MAGPIQDYYVTFWTQGVAARGVPQEMAMWREDMNEIRATDAVEVIEWAEKEAVQRNAIYTIFARMTHHEPGLVWIAGADPTVNAENFETPRPIAATPMAGGTEPYEPHPGRNT
jgi:hypothetical protein